MKSWDGTPEGDESLEQVYCRIGLALDEIVAKHAGQTVVVVSHGDPVLLGQMYFDGAL